MTDHIANRVQHVVLGGDTLIDLAPGQHLATSRPMEIYFDRAEAIAAIRAEHPEFEPSEWTWEPPTAEEIARVRWTHETGGTMWRGHKVRTDRESQGLILAATIRAQPVRWKFADSWADMTPENMQSLADTVAAHIEACFAREEELQNNPDQDINAGWPEGWT